MPDETLLHLRSLEGWFQPYAYALVNAARGAGVPLLVISGRRSPGANESVSGAARSLHLVGQAFDVQVSGYARDDLPWWWWQTLGQYWEAMGGRWGGRFSTPDVNHFDSGGVSI